jgi:hypothetical protein
LSGGRWLLAATAVLANLFGSSLVEAADCPPPDRAWVTLSLDGQSPSEDGSDAGKLYRRVSVLLQAELDRRNLLVCPDTTPAATTVPSARIHLLFVANGLPNPHALDIVVDDAVTGKQVSRRVELSRVPADSRALVIAVGADELLSASWAELALKRPTPPRVAPQPLPRPQRAPAPARRRIELSLLGTAEIDRAARLRLGGALGNAWWPTSRFALSLELGFARGLGFSAPDGSVHTDSFMLGVGLLVPVVEGTHAGLEASVAVRLSRTLVRGEAGAGATSYHGAFSAPGAEAALRGWWAPGASASLPRWALTSHLGVGGWLTDADALDGEEHVKLQRSPFFSGALGVAVQIP